MNEVIQIVIKLLIGYFVLLIASRIMGKKKLNQYTVFDFIFVVMLTGLLEESIYDKETPWYIFIVSVVVWCLINYVITKIEMRFEKLRPVIKGQPVFLIRDGIIQEDTLKENNMELEQLRHALRSKGIFSLSQVQYAILETNGEVNAIRNDSFPVMVIEDGKIVPEKLSGVPEEQIRNYLTSYGLQLQNIFYAELIGQAFYYKSKGGGDSGNSNTETN